MAIHPTVIIEGEIDIASDVEVGPYSVLRGKVTIGSGTRIDPHVTIGSESTEVVIGQRNHIWAGAVIGGHPQDLGYKKDLTRLIIGSDNVFREFSTLHVGTVKGGGQTVVGNNCYMMAYTHLGHDVHLGDRVVIANNSHLGGHTYVEDDVTIGGMCAFNQFVRVGKASFIGGGSIVVKDILPFTRALGNHAVCRASNKVGMQRKGYSPSEVENVHRAIRIILMGSTTLEEGVQRINSECERSPAIDHFIEFIKSSKRGIAK